ncbi:copper amine oxidase N-terminal domain-containing protein [Geobacillus sp. YF-1]|uniref:copper amine oxidase N-terminal domain-containing protein n=1 Tax=Geobacillus sp. YF-1 TaxID=3457480 RepID=UPI0040453461
MKPNQKDSVVSTNTQVHMTSVYTRNKGTNKSVKRSFSFVISNLLISTVLMGALGISGGTVEAASSTQTPTQVVQVTQKYQDDATLLANVNLALDVLKKNGLTLATLSLLHSSLKDIENKVNANQFTSTNNLYKTLVLAESTLSGLSYNITLDVGNEFVESLTVVKRLTPISVYIDGIPQFYKQQPIEQNGIVFVPLRDIYEKLGAKVTSDTKTNTVIITKGNTVIKLPRGKDFAYVNGKSVKLSAKMFIKNGVTMIPVDFLKVSLGSSVEWLSVPKVVVITSKAQTVDGIKVLYGGHTYASRNQKEYDTVMKIVREHISKEYDKLVFGESRNKYYLEYLDGARFNGDKRDRSERNVGLYLAQGSIGELVSAGVSKEGVIRAWKTGFLAGTLASGTVDPGDGKPRSAYDNLVRRVSDCDAHAQVYSAVWDAMGYNTLIIAGSGHADMLVQIEGHWFKPGAGSFLRVDLNGSLKKGAKIIFQPTYGQIK